MKKWICILLCAAVGLSLFACGSSSAKDPGNFYYRRIEPEYLGTEGIIAPESRELFGLREDLQAMLELYFLGPQSSDLESPFPRDTALLDWSLENGVLQLELNDAFTQLTGIELTVACGCIARTFLELPDITAVRIFVEGALLNGESAVTLTKASLQLADDGIDKLRTDLTLYYTDDDRRYLIGQNLSINLAGQSDIVAYLVEQLQTAPTGLGLVSPLPKNTKLLGSTIENGVCTLDFSSEFETNAFSDSYAQRTTLLSLVNTLTQLENIDRVEFQLDGTLLARYRQINISKALVFDESAVGPVRTGVNEFDATLYLCNGSSMYLTAVPARIRYTTGISQPELVVSTLLSYQNSNGFYTLIPEDTQLLDVTVADGACTVNLTVEFLSSSNLTLAVRAICASVSALDGINSVQILIEGGVPQTESADLFEPLTPDWDWFV